MNAVDPDERNLYAVHRNHPFAFQSRLFILIIFYGYSIAELLGVVNGFFEKIEKNIVYFFKTENLQIMLDFGPCGG